MGLKPNNRDRWTTLIDANRDIRYRLDLDKEQQTPTTGQLAEGSAPSTSEGARAVPALSDLA